MKKCTKCLVDKSYDSFCKSKNKPLGLDSACKDCRKIYRQENKEKELARWKRNYLPGTAARRMHIVRSMTRRKHGPAKKHMCSRCNIRQALEWHHIEYKTDTVIALCEPCHTYF